MAQSSIVRGVATYVVNVKVDGEYGLECRYHDTPVARKIGNMVKLQSDGWMTATTKLRMNQFSAQYCNSAYSVWQKEGTWYVTIGENCLLFKDGMEFDITQETRVKEIMS